MVKGVILDLDGTLYRGKEEVPGASGFLDRLSRHGLRRIFVTNRANRAPDAICAQLRGYGMACSAGDVLTSAEATARHLRKGRVYCIGEDAMHAALRERGFTLSEQSADYVIVSFDRSFDYRKLATACRLIRGGAKFIATNPDKVLRTDEGLLPGTGSIVAAVAAAAGVEPTVIGKPEPLLFEIALKRLGLEPGLVIAVGDNLATDVPAGQRAGLRTALILSGVSGRDDLRTSAVQPTWVAADHGELWQIIERENGP